MEECLASDAANRPGLWEVAGRLQDMVAALPVMRKGRKSEQVVKLGISAAAEMGMKLFWVMDYIVAVLFNFITTDVKGI